MIRVVLDTNVIVSGILKEEGIPAKLLKAFLEENKFLLVTSPEILKEIAAVLKYDRIQNIHGWNDEKIESFVMKLLTDGLVVKEEVRVRLIKDDPEDDKFINCALAGKADFIVSGDAHLLKLNEYQEIKIVTPRVFFERLKTEPDVKQE